MGEHRTEMIGIRVEPELRAKIEQAAERERRSVSNFLRNLAAEYVQALDSGPVNRAA